MIVHNNSIFGHLKNKLDITHTVFTQVNRMSKSRMVLATGGKQRSFGLHMVCFEMVLYHNEPHYGMKSTYKP